MGRRVDEVAGLNDLDDQELVLRGRAGDERALEELLERYRHFARSKARFYFLSGSDKEDVIQEGMIGLYKAIRDFDPQQATPFRVFAELCISRQILTAIKTANRHKHQPLNSSVSLDAPAGNGDDALSIADRLVAPALYDPAELVISAEEVEAIQQSMRKTLTSLEGQVLKLYIDGKSYEEIAAALGNHVKSIDNALQRIKRKLQRYVTTRNSLASS